MHFSNENFLFLQEVSEETELQTNQYRLLATLPPLCHSFQ